MAITWALVANRSEARILESRGPGRGLVIIEQIDHPEGHWRDRDWGSDRGGRSFDSHGAARHALDTETAPHDHAATRFAEALAQKLRSARAAHRFDRLVLAAEPSFLGRLRAALDDVTRGLVAGEVPKQLVHAGDGDVERQLASIVAV